MMQGEQMNLYNLISDQKARETIKELADEYNFTNVRLYFEDIYPYPSPGPLVLMVDSSKENENLGILLGAKLTKELQIDVNIVYSSEIASKNLLANRAIPLNLPLEEVKLRIEKLSNIPKDLDKIEYKKANLEKRSLKRTLEMAKIFDSKIQSNFESKKLENNNLPNSIATCFYDIEEKLCNPSEDSDFASAAAWQSHRDQF